MSEEHLDSLIQGRGMLQTAAETYERPLSPEEYWFLGAGLAACTLAELEGKTFAVSRVEQLMDRLGYKGIQGDWFQRFLEELSALDADGLLWPVYERNAEGAMAPTGLQISVSFDGEAGYYLALAHLGVALALNREDAGAVEHLAGILAELVEEGLKPEHRESILQALEPLAGEGEGDEAGGP